MFIWHQMNYSSYIVVIIDSQKISDRIRSLLKYKFYTHMCIKWRGIQHCNHFILCADRVEIEFVIICSVLSLYGILTEIGPLFHEVSISFSFYSYNSFPSQTLQSVVGLSVLSRLSLTSKCNILVCVIVER
jgi:hypothetical protein